MDRFVACWDGLDDPRTGNAALHDVHELLVTALSSVLCSGQGAVDLALFARSKEPFLRGFLTLANGVPSHDTFSRLFRQIDPEAFRAVFQRFMAVFAAQCRSLAPGATSDAGAASAVAAGVVAIDESAAPLVIIAAKTYRLTELVANGHLHQRGFWETVETADGPRLVLGPQFRLSATPRHVQGAAAVPSEQVA